MNGLVDGARRWALRVLQHLERRLQRVQQMNSGCGATPQMPDVHSFGLNPATSEGVQYYGCQFNLDGPIQHSVGRNMVKVDDQRTGVIGQGNLHRKG